MNKYVGYTVLMIVLWAGVVQSGGYTLSWSPQRPSSEEQVTIMVEGAEQGGILHWGVNSKGNAWRAAAACYQPAGSQTQGIATRTPLEGPDKAGVCRITLGPFNKDEQMVGSVDFVIQWDNGMWDNNAGRDYHIPIEQARIETFPKNPTFSQAITVLVHRAKSGGALRWGVNGDQNGWTTVHTNYWTKRSKLADDGIGVDSPLWPPDSKSNAIIVLGPFDQGCQVVTSLHMAVHWDDDWDSNLGRNYNVAIRTPVNQQLTFLSPREGYITSEDVSVRLGSLEPARIWLNGMRAADLTGPGASWLLHAENGEYGHYILTAKSLTQENPEFARVEFWYVPKGAQENVLVSPPRAAPQGASVGEKNRVLFSLYRPGAHFVSLVGDFNAWDKSADYMHHATNGLWWIEKTLKPGAWKYQFVIDGDRIVGDPYARDVSWVDDQGRETYLPEMAKAVVRVGGKPFKWGDRRYQRPGLTNVVIYELHIGDFCQHGFDGLRDKLDYIESLGVNAIEPLPVTEFAGKIGWGYNPSYHFAPESSFGKPDDLRKLVNEAHRRGIAVIGDLVLNHMDRNSALFQLYGDDYEASPYFRLFTGENWGFPDLDQQSPAFKRYVSDLLNMWLRDYHLDGFRFDATRWVGWEGYNDWGASWFAYVGHRVDSNSYQIAEHIPADPDLMNQTEMDASWYAAFRWRLRDMIVGAELNADNFKRIMAPELMGFSNGFQRVVYIESHDDERIMRDLHEKGYKGEEAVNRALLGAAVTLTAPGVPMLYAGQEFGEDTPKIVGPNPLQWEKGDSEQGRRIHDRIRDLIHLRTHHPALASDELEILINDADRDVFLYRRGTPDNPVFVAGNMSRSPAEITIPATDLTMLWGSARVPDGTHTTIKLPAGAAEVLFTQ